MRVSRVPAAEVTSAAMAATAPSTTMLGIGCDD